jgi:dihydroorotate dehydrogenase
VGEVLWQRLLRPLLFVLDPETAHRVAFGALRLGLSAGPVRALARRLTRPDPALAVRAFGVDFPSPVGLAAGFDKDATGFRQLGALGFGFVEVGTVTPRPQPGNARPRLFRLPADRALVNRMGFNSGGVEAALRGLRRRDAHVVVGVNVGKNKSTPEERAIDDFVAATRALAPSADYVAVNVSSPNTPGLRDLQAVERLRPILAAVQEAAGPKPVLVKIAPDLSDEDLVAVADLALELGLAGIIATNTTVARDGLRTPAGDVGGLGAGGLSGPPLRERALEVLRLLHERTDGRVTLVAAGGIETAADARARIDAGATLVQLYTGFVYGGPAAPRRIARGLLPRASASRDGQQADENDDLMRRA